MKKKNSWILFVLGFALLFIVASAMYEHLGSDFDAGTIVENEGTSDKEEKKKGAPDIIVYDIDENKVKLSDFLGTPVVLNFWASWCGPCKSEMPDFQAVYEEYGDKVQFLMVNFTDGERETVATGSAFIENMGYTFPVYYDTEWSAAYAYGVQSIPRTYFIDKEGYVIDSAYGALSENGLLKRLKKILSE